MSPKPAHLFGFQDEGRRMSDVAAQRLAVPPRGFPPGLRGRVALTFTVIVLAACVVAAALLFSHALNERQAIRDRALSTAVALSFGFDQEVAAGNALLKGLSSSPALRTGDTKAFYDQLKATPIPDGSWLILQDLEGQVVNTLRPFGAPLPRHRDFPTYPEALNRVRERGWTVSGRMASLVKPGTTIIALSLRINHDDGTMKGFITTMLSQDRLGTILGDQKVPDGWTTGLYDRRLQPIVTMRGAETSSHIPVPSTLAEDLAGRDASATVDGVTEGVDEHGTPVLVAYRRSGATNWTSAVTVPLALVNAPVTGVLWQMAGPTALLLFAGGLAALFTARQVERPLRTLSHLVTAAESEVTELSAQLLALQEEERQRIARELHDSTAQHLVATNLGLMRLAGEVRQSPAALKTCRRDRGPARPGASGAARLHLPAPSAQSRRRGTAGDAAGVHRRVRGAHGIAGAGPGLRRRRQRSAGDPACDPAGGAGGARQCPSPRGSLAGGCRREARRGTSGRPGP